MSPFVTDIISLEQQIPPKPPEGSDDNEPAREGRIPKTVRLARLRAWLRFIRIRFAHFILLPELSWEQARDLRQSVHRDGALTSGYMLMCALSAGIATLGLLQSSTAVVIGAMLISPLMSPIAALGFGFASIDGSRIRDAIRVVAVGAAIGILTGILLTWLSPIRNATPEILARTQPTLLDLAVALFSGIAGGYATVIQRGGTAIGVAIATALMPPLAVLGYGIGMFQPRFAAGALLLFLTNLAAITFSFAVIARLSGVARPLYKVEWRPRFVVVFVLVFMALAAPLSMTLFRLSEETAMRAAARTAILEACGGERADMAQLEVSWPLFGEPTVDALVVSPTYSPNAEQEAERRLAALIDEEVQINLQQVQAADFQSQARAMIDAAMERTTAGIAADVPPYDRIRASIGLPTRAIWTNTAERRVYVEPIPAPDWTLSDYAQVERQANTADNRWNVRVIPPPQPVLNVALEQRAADAIADDDDRISPQLAGWALLRWGMNRVTMDAPAGDRTRAFINGLKEAGITAVWSPPDAAEGADDEAPPAVGPQTAVIRVYRESPTRAAAAAAAAAAERQQASAPPET